MKRNSKKGFTLVELLVVIAILGVLATVSIVGYSSYTTRAKQTKAVAEGREVYELIMASTVGDATYTYDASNKKTYTISFDADSGLVVTKNFDGIGASAEVICKSIIGENNLVKGAKYGVEKADLIDGTTVGHGNNFAFDKVLYVSTNDCAVVINLTDGSITNVTGYSEFVTFTK